MRKEKVKFVSCGDEHTALLTEVSSVHAYDSILYASFCEAKACPLDVLHHTSIVRLAFSDDVHVTVIHVHVV